jgi:uncharacterized membrane protein
VRSSIALFLALLASSALSVGALAVEVHATGSSAYRFLVWNLFLAWIPLGAAVLSTFSARRRLVLPALLFGLVWLLFFPNAPYMLTDYIHLGQRDFRGAPLWYDALMISAFVWTSLMLGFVSLYLMHRCWAGRLGRAASWCAVVGVFALSSFGVYLGRFIRFNSWDALIRPARLAHVVSNELANPIEHPALIGTVGLITAFLTTAYVCLYSFARMTAAIEPLARTSSLRGDPVNVVRDGAGRV